MRFFNFLYRIIDNFCNKNILAIVYIYINWTSNYTYL